MLISRLFGFLRESVIAATYGTSAETDAFFMAQSILIILYTLIGTSCIGVIFQPQYTKLSVSDPSSSRRFASNVISALAVLSLLLAGGIFALGKPLAHFFSPNFAPEQIALTADFLRRLAFFYPFAVIALIYAAVLNSHRRFAMSQLSGLPPSLCVIVATLLFSRRFGILSAVSAVAAGWVVQCAVTLLSARRTFRYAPVLDLRDPGLRTLLALLLPAFIGVAIGDVNGVIDRMLASGLPEGSVSGINYASRLFNTLHGTVIAALGTAMLPALSGLAAVNDTREFGRTVRAATGGICFVMLPVTVAAALFSREIVATVFERGAFDRAATQVTSPVFLYYALGLPFLALSHVVTRAFYALQDSKTPMYGGALGVGLNVALNLLLIRPMQAAGLALATSVATAVSAAYLALRLRARLPGIFSPEGALLAGAARVTALACLSALPAALCRFALRAAPPTVSLVLGAAVYGAVYFALSCRLGLPEAGKLLGLLRRALGTSVRRLRTRLQTR